MPREKISSFIVMYHIHCQRIFDTLVRGTLDDVHIFLEHFWQEVPSHLCDLLNTNTLVNMVGVSDLILYRKISHTVMRSVFKKCSHDFIRLIQNFSEKLENWIDTAMIDIPANLRRFKLKLSKRFCATLRRQIVLHQQLNSALFILNNAEMMFQIYRDWKKINLGLILKQALIFTECATDLETIKFIISYWRKFPKLIEQKKEIEGYTEKLEILINCCIVEMTEKNQVPLRKVARNFILLWHSVESLISRDMIINSSLLFGTFHVIQSLFDEYLHYLLEMILSENLTQYLLDNVSLDVLPDLDSPQNEFSETSYLDFFEMSPNLHNFAGESSEDTQNNFSNPQPSYYPHFWDFNASKVNFFENNATSINQQDFLNRPVGYTQPMYSPMDAFANFSLSDFNFDHDRLEFQ